MVGIDRPFTSRVTLHPKGWIPGTGPGTTQEAKKTRLDYSAAAGGTGAGGVP